MGFYNRFSSYDYAEKLESKFSIPRTTTYGEDNKFFFSSTTGVIGVRSNGTMHCRLVDTFRNLIAGDVIDVSFEVRLLFGTKPKVAFREFNDSGNAFDMHIYTTESEGEWVTHSFKYVYRNLNNAQKLDFNIGLYTGDTGQFEIRNLRVNIQTKRNYDRPMTYKPYELRKGATAFEIRGDFTNAGGTLSVVDTTTLRLTFSNPFRNRPVITSSVDFVGASGNYTIRVGNLNTTAIDIKFYDSSGSAALLSSIPEGCHFGIVAFGWEVV